MNVNVNNIDRAIKDLDIILCNLTDCILKAIQHCDFKTMNVSIDYIDFHFSDDDIKNINNLLKENKEILYNKDFVNTFIGQTIKQAFINRYDFHTIDIFFGNSNYENPICIKYISFRIKYTINIDDDDNYIKHIK